MQFGHLSVSLPELIEHSEGLYLMNEENDTPNIFFPPLD